MMREYSGKELPRLPENQFSLVHVDAWTGKVLDVKGQKPCDVAKEDWVLIFDSMEEAETYAKNIITLLPDVKCSIYDHQKQWVKDVSNTGRVKDSRPKSSSAWWKFWR